MTGLVPEEGHDPVSSAWVDQVRAALASMLADAGRAPGDPDVEALIELIDCGRRLLADPRSLTRATAEGIGGAAFEMVAMSSARRGGEEPIDLLPGLMFFALRPYLGVEAALAEFHRAAGESPLAKGGSGS